MAYRLNSVESTVKLTDAIRLVRRFGVPRSKCTTNSIEWEAPGKNTALAIAALQAGSALLKACVTAP
jgi:hypothetical protein